MKISKKVLFPVLIVALMAGMLSCNTNGRLGKSKKIVINEIMASNRTGLQAPNGKPVDWIELKNTGNDTIDLLGFELSLTKLTEGEDPDADPVEETKTWQFPSVKIGAGECLVILTDKGSAQDFEDELIADFKLPKDGGTIQFSAPNGKVISEVTYERLSADQAYARNEHNKFEATYMATPGFDNTPEGYAKANEKIYEGRGPLLFWELMSKSENPSENWVELKNTGNSAIDLSSYSLAKKMDKNEESWRLPARTLEPGQIVTIKLAGIQFDKSDELQAPIQLGNSETLVLTKNGNFADGINGKSTPAGSTVGRRGGSKGFLYFPTPTRNAENSGNGTPLPPAQTNK